MQIKINPPPKENKRLIAVPDCLLEDKHAGGITELKDTDNNIWTISGSFFSFEIEEIALADTICEMATGKKGKELKELMEKHYPTAKRLVIFVCDMDSSKGKI